jgi:hypothetical protein
MSAETHLVLPFPLCLVLLEAGALNPLISESETTLPRHRQSGQTACVINEVRQGGGQAQL